MDSQGFIERSSSWVLFRGSRLVVAGGILLGFIALYLVVGSTGIFVIGTAQRLLWLMNGALNGILTLVTIVIAVNQLILSQEFGAVGDQHKQVETMVEFREHVEAKTEQPVSPPEPAAFLRGLFQALSQQTKTLGTERNEIPDIDQHFHDAIDAYVAQFSEQLEETIAFLDESEIDRLSVLTVILNYNDSVQLYATRRIQNQYAANLTQEMTESLTAIRELLVDFDTVRQYFKTTYIQRELAELSRQLLYSGLLSVSIAGLVILSIRQPAAVQISGSSYLVVTILLIALTLAPLAILAAYMLRIATVARQTAAFGPFIFD